MAGRKRKRQGALPVGQPAQQEPASAAVDSSASESSQAAESGRIFTLRGASQAVALLPALLMVLLSLLPSLAARGAVRKHSWIAAGLALLCTLMVAKLVRDRGDALQIELSLRRPHYMQALTQAGVFIYWGMYWAPVKDYAWLILIQVALAYQADMLLAWWRGQRWVLGFGQFPIVFSVNLFMWFKDDYFGWQLLLVALAYAGKWLITWQRDGRRRHIFNPSSFGLGGVSLVLLLTGTSSLTWGREIALTQEDPRYMFEALFALGLIVQLQFPVVLITASAALTTWLLGALWLRITGVYMFGTTDIPAAVMLGMLLLVTDPATSPKGRTAKVLFGAGYGFLVFALYPILEALGSYGYYDKLLPVPILNLLVGHFDSWGARLDTRLRGTAAAAEAAIRPARNVVHVGAWAAIFVMLWATDAFSAGHPGREITFWQRACEAKRWSGCGTYFKLLTSSCRDGKGEACHNLGVELLEREQQGTLVVGRDSGFFLDRACQLGIPQSCALRQQQLAGADRNAPSLDPLAAMTQACNDADASACHNLAHVYGQGTPTTAPDRVRARAFYQRGCDLGLAQSCNSLAALAMSSGEHADTELARNAFSKSCEIGDAPGCANLALMYLSGRGVSKDEPRAAQLHDKACQLKLALACYRLADAYRVGTGVPVDAAKSAELTQQACALGYAPACGGSSPAP